MHLQDLISTVRLGLKSWLLLMIMAGIGIYIWFFYFFTYTDDAYLDTHVISLSSVVSGYVIKLNIIDNQTVNPGDALFTIDPEPYQITLEKAQARLSSEASNYTQDKNRIQLSIQQLKQSRLELKRANDHFTRIQGLYKRSAIADIQYEDALTTLKMAKEAVLLQQEKLKMAKNTLSSGHIEEAEAAIAAAQYKLKHAIIQSPVKGTLANMKLNTGSYVKAGSPLFAIVDNQHWWVVAYFRETVLRHIKVGDHATVSIDMYPGKSFSGTVESIGWGINRQQASSNAKASILEYSKPTENWISLAQRFPVRIRLNHLPQGITARVGASAQVKIDTNA